MRRLIAILVLLILPLQLSWAGVTSYCKHETGAAAKHFGHHEHQHHAQAVKADKADHAAKTDNSDKSTGNYKFDGDCGFCQFGGLSMMSMSVPEMPASLAQDTYHITPIDFLSSHRPDRPERPKWARVV